MEIRLEKEALIDTDHMTTLFHWNRVLFKYILSFCLCFVLSSSFFLRILFISYVQPEPHQCTLKYKTPMDSYFVSYREQPF